MVANLGTDQQLVVDATGLHVTYTVYEDAAIGLKGRIAGRTFRRKSRLIHAVRGVDFHVLEGESVGLIGPNGSGKSTLLAAISGLLPIDDGEVLVASRPTLLGVGAALRPNLSGRLNLVIGGLALGLSRVQIDEQIDEMIAFSGLSDSIDLPLNTYSSGMKARLAFTVATANSPEILVIDEALAVGDAAFQKKSGERIAEIRSNAGAVIIVSHNLSEIRSGCDRVYWIEAGQVRAVGAADQVVDAYKESLK